MERFERVWLKLCPSKAAATAIKQKQHNSGNRKTHATQK
jgi:hypothetical protein